jgi:hypothetical protein
LQAEKLIWLFAGLYCLLVFIFLREQTLKAQDPANFFLAIKYGFSLSAERPHAPGYPLFVFLWQVIVSIFHTDPHSAIIVLNTVFLFFSIVLCFYFTKTYWGSRAAMISTLLVVCNPVVLYYSSVTEIYIYDLFFSIGAIYLILSCKSRFVPLAFFLLGLAMGFRLSSVILLAPVIAIALYFRADRKAILSLRTITLSIPGFLLGMSVWVIPFYISDGGFVLLQQALHDAADLNSTIYQNAAVYLSYLVWSVNIGICIFFFRFGKDNSQSKQQKILLAAWFLIPTFFFIFEHYAKGYILLILPAIIISVASRIRLIQSRWKRRTVLTILAAINLSLFFFMPFIAPTVESNLPKAQRSSGERLQTAFLRSLSFFAPAYSHIKTADAAMTEANRMIERYSPSGSVIIVDNTAGSWAFQRSLQAYHPARYFVQGNRMDTNVVTLFFGSEIDRAYSVGKILAADTLYYLIDPRFVGLFGTPPDAKLLSSGSWVSLYILSGKEKNLFWKYFSKTK